MLTKFQKLKNGIIFNRKPQKETEQTNKPVHQYTDDELQTSLKFFHQLSDNAQSKEEKKYSLLMYTFMKRHKIDTRGNNILLPSLSYNKLKEDHQIHPEIVQSLEKNFGFENLTAIQSLAIPNILQNRNLVGIAPTGSGKTLAYLIPLVNQLLANKDKTGKKALIIAPTFELSIQIYKVCLTLIGKTMAIGGLKIGHIHKIESNMKDYDLLVSTPKKFLDLYSQNEPQDSIDFNYIVLDEADKYFELSFMEDLEKLLDVLKANERQYLLFSATMPEAIERAINSIFVDKIEVIIGGKVRVLNTIDQKLIYVSSEEGKVLELENIINEGRLRIPCLVFVQSKDRVREVNKLLKKCDIRADYLCSTLSYAKREEKIKQFEEGRIWVLVTTDLLARGVDFPDLKLVINFDFPTNMVTYVHRVGRTGRANKEGTAITLFTNDDKYAIRRLAELLKSSGCDVPEWIFKVKKLSKKDMKKLERKPIKRESLLRGKVKKDKELFKELKKKDYLHHREQEKNKEFDNESEEEEIWTKQ